MAIPKFRKPDLEAICKVLGDTAGGLTGSEIGQILSDQGINDPNPSITKWRRLFEALDLRQEQDDCGNNVAGFIKSAMAPVRYSANLQLFEARRSALNAVLAFSGYTLATDGEIETTSKAATLDEARERADSLAHKLRQRGVHPDVLRFCRAELVEHNYFHAVPESTKSVAEKIRERTALTTDGALLVDAAFGGEHPLLALNTLRTDTERSEQVGSSIS